METPKVGDWVTMQAEFPWESSPGKVMTVDEESKKFRAEFACESTGDMEDRPSFEAATTCYFRDIHEIIRDPKVIEFLENEYRKAHE